MLFDCLLQLVGLVIVLSPHLEFVVLLDVFLLIGFDIWNEDLFSSFSRYEILFIDNEYNMKKK